jgi:hypothetical protein
VGVQKDGLIENKVRRVLLKTLTRVKTLSGQRSLVSSVDGCCSQSKWRRWRTTAFFVSMGKRSEIRPVMVLFVFCQGLVDSVA